MNKRQFKNMVRDYYKPTRIIVQDISFTDRLPPTMEIYSVYEKRGLVLAIISTREDPIKGKLFRVTHFSHLKVVDYDF